MITAFSTCIRFTGIAYPEPKVWKGGAGGPSPTNWHDATMTLVQENPLLHTVYSH